MDAIVPRVAVLHAPDHGGSKQAAGSRQQEQQEQQDGKQSVVEPASSGRGSEGQRARGTAAKAYVADVERIAP